MTDTQQKNSADVAEEWFSERLGESSDGARRGARRAARARLRRARTAVEIMLEPEALRLVAALPGEYPDRVAVLAGVLAFVEEKDDRNIARVVGRKSLDDEEAVVSEMRFRRLLQTPGDELLDPMRRLVRLNKGKANVHDMSFSVLRWGDKVRKRWIFDYYGVSDGAAGR